MLKVKAIGRSKFPTEEHLTIFNDTASGMTLRRGMARPMVWSSRRAERAPRLSKRVSGTQDATHYRDLWTLTFKVAARARICSCL